MNIASRVEGFAPIGGISISDKVYNDISGVSNIQTTFLGHRKLKGVEQETKVRCITSNSLPTIKVNKYINLLGGFLIFWGIMNVIASTYESMEYIKLETSNWFDLELQENIVFIFYGLMEILIGYNIYSYIRGISHKAQRYFIIFGFVISIWEIVILITIPFIVQAEGLYDDFRSEFLTFMGMLILFGIAGSLIIRNKFINEEN